MVVPGEALLPLVASVVYEVSRSGPRMFNITPEIVCRNRGPRNLRQGGHGDELVTQLVDKDVLQKMGAKKAGDEG